MSTLPNHRDQLRDTGEYRHCIGELHHAGELFRMLPYVRDLDPETFDKLTAHLQRIVDDLQALHASHCEST